MPSILLLILIAFRGVGAEHLDVHGALARAIQFGQNH